MILDNSLALRRPFRDRSFGVARKLMRVNWLFVLCVCLLAGVGYAALYSAAGGSPQPYAQSQLYRFFGMLVMMLGIAMVDIRFIAKLSWPAYARGDFAAAGGDGGRPYRARRQALDRSWRRSRSSRAS